MQESMQAALTWVRSNAARLGLAEDFNKDLDLHIHVPAGAIPKDGPSAGVTMVTVLASLLTDTPVRPLTAMTGEITLSGNVLPVGGIKEKFLAARRAGVQTIILPAENRQNVEEDLTPEMIKGVEVHYASGIEDVLAVALPLLAARPQLQPSAADLDSERRGVSLAERFRMGRRDAPAILFAAANGEEICRFADKADRTHQEQGREQNHGGHDTRSFRCISRETPPTSKMSGFRSALAKLSRARFTRPLSNSTCKARRPCSKGAQSSSVK